MDRRQRTELAQLSIEDLRTLYQEFLGKVPVDNLTSEQLLDTLERRPILDALSLELDRYHTVCKLSVLLGFAVAF